MHRAVLLKSFKTQKHCEKFIRGMEVRVAPLMTVSCMSGYVRTMHHRNSGTQHMIGSCALYVPCACKSVRINILHIHMHPALLNHALFNILSRQYLSFTNFASVNCVFKICFIKCQGGRSSSSSCLIFIHSVPAIVLQLTFSGCATVIMITL